MGLEVHKFPPIVAWFLIKGEPNLFRISIISGILSLTSSRKVSIVTELPNKILLLDILIFFNSSMELKEIIEFSFSFTIGLWRFKSVPPAKNLKFLILVRFFNSSIFNGW